MFPDLIDSSATSIVLILGAMLLVALIEVLVPLRERTAWSAIHLGPNLTLTFITFATNMVFNVLLLATLVWLQSNSLGLLNNLALAPFAAVAVVVLVLDFSFYVAHVSMHKLPSLWRFHSVHHSDPAVDVTTTIRQHPGESVIRYAWLAAFAIALGAGPAAFAVYRSWSALNGLLEHANIRVPAWLDNTLALVTTWPNLHKIHHSRHRHQTDTNYGNIFSFWDRLGGTFTPSKVDASIDYGLAGFDDPARQTTRGLLVAPFQAFRSPAVARMEQTR